MRHITSKSNLQQRCLFNTLARLKASRKLCYIHSISTGARFLPIKCIKRYTNIPFMQHQWKILYIFIYTYIICIYIYMWTDVYFLLFGSSLKCCFQKNVQKCWFSNSLPSSLRCQAPNSMHNQADLSPMQSRAVHWTKKCKNKKN